MPYEHARNVREPPRVDLFYLVGTSIPDDIFLLRHINNLYFFESETIKKKYFIIIIIAIGLYT